MKILLFSLYTGIRIHTVQENVIVKTLLKNNFDVGIVTCGGILKEHCTSMSAYGVNSTDSVRMKNIVCKKCIKDSEIMLKPNNIKKFSITEYISDVDLLCIENVIKEINKNNFLNFQYDGIEIGKIALYEVLLKYKKMSLDFDTNEWKEYIIYLKNTLLSLFAFKKIYTNFNPEKVIIYSPQYATNGVAAEYSIKYGSKVVFLEGSSSNAERYSALRLWDWNKYGLVNPALTFWKEKHKFISKMMIDRSIKHIDELLEASSHAVYSESIQTSFNLREYYKIPQGKKIFLATLSSFDEAFAAYSIGKFPEVKVNCSYFRDQFEWIRYTIEYFTNKLDFYLIIRMHPRDFPNKRENIESEQAKIWLDMFKNLPSNIIINYPYEKISLYNILPEIDLLLTGWSATSIEAMLYKIPVVTYYEYLPSYPSDIHYTGLSISEYLDNLDKAIKNGRESKNFKNAILWMAFNFSMGTIEHSKPLQQYLNKKNLTSFLLRVINRLFPNFLFKFDLINLKMNKINEDLFIDFISKNRTSLYETYNEYSNSSECDIDEYLEKLLYQLNIRLGVNK